MTNVKALHDTESPAHVIMRSSIDSQSGNTISFFSFFFCLLLTRSSSLSIILMVNKCLIITLCAYIFATHAYV